MLLLKDHKLHLKKCSSPLPALKCANAAAFKVATAVWLHIFVPFWCVTLKCSLLTGTSYKPDIFICCICCVLPMVWQCVANREPRTHSWPALAAAACLDQFETELHPSFIMSTSTRHVYGLLIQWPQSPLLTFHKSSLCLLPSMLIPPLSYHISLPLSQSPLSLSHFPPTLRPDKVLWGLDCWLSPNLLHNRTVSFPESLRGQASLSLATYLASISLFNAQQQSFCLLGFTVLLHF